MSRDEPVFFSLLLDIPNLLGHLLKRVLVVGIGRLQVC